MRKKKFLDDRTKGKSQNPQDDPKNNYPTRWMLEVFLYLLDNCWVCPQELILEPFDSRFCEGAQMILPTNRLVVFRQDPVTRRGLQNSTDVYTVYRVSIVSFFGLKLISPR